MSRSEATSPYQDREPRSFWRSGVAESETYPPADIFRPRFAVTRDMPIFTAGSCFAQHVGRVLRENGFAVLDGEPAPEGLPLPLAQRYGYRIYSGRYGNVYTVRQMLQLVQEAHGLFEPADAIWEKNGAYFDALRPNVEPDGLVSAELVQLARKRHLELLRETLDQAQVLVFTLGLTECWEHTASGTVYPTAPGTIAGAYDPEVYGFRNLRAHEIRSDFLELRKLLKAKNPDLRFILTVSPVPLTATAEDQHVLPATIYSKSVLRSVAGELYQDFEDVDYFPSYEIISSHPAPTEFYEDNLRAVAPAGVSKVMQSFLTAHGVEVAEDPPSAQNDKRAMRLARRARRERLAAQDNGAEVVCEDELLEAFSK